jgi:hypothetical protein
VHILVHREEYDNEKDGQLHLCPDAPFTHDDDLVEVSSKLLVVRWGKCSDRVRLHFAFQRGKDSELTVTLTSAYCFNHGVSMIPFNS